MTLIKQRASYLRWFLVLLLGVFLGLSLNHSLTSQEKVNLGIKKRTVFVDIASDGTAIAEYEGFLSKDGEFVKDGRFLEFHRNGTVSRLGRYEKGVPVGRIHSFREDGTPATFAEYNELGSHDGQAFGWHENGRLFVRHNWNNGVQVGFLRTYHPNGILSSYCRFRPKEPTEDDRRTRIEGHSLRWHPSGALESIRTFSEGRAVGIWTTYYESGQLKSEFRPSEAGKTGPDYEWHENGQLAAERHWDDEGRKTGTWSTWNTDGELLSDEEYMDGVKVE